MANYANAKATIAANIYTNHLGQVTAEMVKTAANAIVDTLIAGGYLYAGVAHPGDPAVSPDANVFYIATEAGTYTNKGGLVVADGEVAVLKFNGTWSKEVTGAATAAQVTELGQELDTCVKESDITTTIVSNNIANPANVWDKSLISSTGKLLTKDGYNNYKATYINVNPGDIVTIGGNDLNHRSWYCLYESMPTPSSTAGGATIPIEYGEISQQEMINGKTITIPNDCHYLFWQVQYDGSPSSENVKIQANRGNALLPYDSYQEAITSINGIPLASAVPSDLEERVEQLESDVEDLQGQVLSSLIADLPVSADGSGIDVGYAYINSSTGVVTVKLS